MRVRVHGEVAQPAISRSLGVFLHCGIVKGMIDGEVNLYRENCSALSLKGTSSTCGGSDDDDIEVQCMAARRIHD